jgi:protein-S-isoprenylcysteine O-methyltransferase Ste14
VKRCHPIESQSASVGHNVLKTSVQIAAMWTFFLALVPFVIATVEARLVDWHLPNIPLWIGWTLFAVLGSVGIYSGMLFAVHGKGTPIPFDTTTKFIVLGPYRWIRNPMAFTGIGQGVAVSLLWQSPAVLIYSLSGAVAWHLVARPWEERDLVARFGQPYEDYREAVPNWWIRLRPYPRIVQSKVKNGR